MKKATKESLKITGTIILLVLCLSAGLKLIVMRITEISDGVAKKGGCSVNFVINKD